MRRRRVRVLGCGVAAALVAGLLAWAGSVAVGAPGAVSHPPGLGSDLASTPSRPLGEPLLPVAESSVGELAVPSWPVSSLATVGLSSLGAGVLSAGSPVVDGGGKVSSSSSSVVWVGPAGAGRLGPVQASAGAGSGKSGRGSVPGSVLVRVLGRDVIAPVGGFGVGVVVNRTDRVGLAGPVRVRVDYSGFAEAFGGSLAGRLRLVEFRACALSTPDADGCARPVYVQDVVNDVAKGVLTGTVDANADPTVVGVSSFSSAAAGRIASSGVVVAVVASGSSDGGDYRATDLAPSGSWSVSSGSGNFSYSVPIGLPPAPYGAAPKLSLDYSSQSVDGMTSATNNQGSTVGLGWSLSSAFVERRYRRCADDGQGSGEGDLCWYSPYDGSGHAGDEVYEISLNGQVSALTPDPADPDVFRLADDPGWSVRRLFGAPNDDGGDAGTQASIGRC